MSPALVVRAMDESEVDNGQNKDDNLKTIYNEYDRHKSRTTWYLQEQQGKLTSATLSKN